MHAKSLQWLWLFATPWTGACQASPAIEFSKQEYWSGLPFPSPGDHPDPRVEPLSLKSPALAGMFFTSSTTREDTTYSVSVQSLSCVWLCDLMNCSMPGLPVHHQFPELYRTHVHRVGDTISSFVIPFSSCLQSFPASGFFASGGQSTGVSVSASVLPMNSQDWLPLRID